MQIKKVSLQPFGVFSLVWVVEYLDRGMILKPSAPKALNFISYILISGPSESISCCVCCKNVVLLLLTWKLFKLWLCVFVSWWQWKNLDTNYWWYLQYNFARQSKPIQQSKKECKDSCYMQTSLQRHYTMQSLGNNQVFKTTLNCTPIFFK